MRIGASIWPWKWNAPYSSAIARLARVGFKATELIAWHPDDLTGYYTPQEISRLRRVLDDHDMVLSQFVVNNTHTADADPAKRQGAVDAFKRAVDVGAELGATVINTVTHVPFGLDVPHLVERPQQQTFTMQLPEGLDWNQNWNDYIEAISACASYAHGAGVVYSLEPHPFRYGANVEGMLRILDAVDSPALGVNFDPSHLFPVGDIPQMAIARLGDRVVHCHFSDNDGTTNAHWRPGKGKIDWKATLAALQAVGYTGVLSLEFEDVPGVSRGTIAGADLPANWFLREEASDEFETEYRIALSYLSDLAKELNIPLD